MTFDPKKLQPREAGKPVSPLCQLCVVRYSPCGKFLAGGGYEGQVRLWDDKLAPLPDLGGHHGWVQGMAFHPGGKLLFTADSWGKLCAWSFAEKGTKPTWSHDQAHAAWVRQLAVGADGKLLASCSSDGVVRLWSCEKGEKLREWAHPEDVLSVAFHPDGKSLVFGDLKGKVHQHDCASGKLLRTFDASAMHKLDRIQEVGGVRRLAFDTAGTTLVTAGCQPTTGGFVQGSALVIYFEAATGKAKQTLKIGGTNEGYVNDLHWHKDGFVMAVTSGQPGQGKLLFHRPGDAAPFFLTPKMPNCQSLAVHPEGRRLVVAATNANSSGNGRPKAKEGEYPGNSSPLHSWELPA